MIQNGNVDEAWTCLFCLFVLTVNNWFKIIFQTHGECNAAKNSGSMASSAGQNWKSHTHTPPIINAVAVATFPRENGHPGLNMTFLLLSFPKSSLRVRVWKKNLLFTAKTLSNAHFHSFWPIKRIWQLSSAGVFHWNWKFFLSVTHNL